jgi:hypothetical protein
MDLFNRIFEIQKKIDAVTTSKYEGMDQGMFVPQEDPNVYWRDNSYWNDEEIAVIEKTIQRRTKWDQITSHMQAVQISHTFKPEYFEQPNIAKYFEIVKDFYDKRQKLPTVTEIKPYLTIPHF